MPETTHAEGTRPDVARVRVSGAGFSLSSVPGTGVRAQADRSVALVLTAVTSHLNNDTFFSSLLKSLELALSDSSLPSVLVAPRNQVELAAAQEYLLGGQFGGVILLNPDINHALPERLREAGIAVVLRGTPPRGVSISHVDIDNRGGARLAVDHLISLGRRRIAVISGLLDQVDGVDRQIGYRDALTGAGMPLDPTLEEVADYLPDRAHMAMERLLLNHPDVDAVFAASDLMASAAIGVLRQAKKRIPEDVAVIGFDDSPTALTTNPPLSSIRQRIEVIGRETVSLLIHEMAHPGGMPRQVLFPTELVIRESTVGEAVVGEAAEGQASATIS